MSRQSRTYSESKVYHIMFGGVNYQNLFEEKQDYQKLYETILQIKEVTRQKGTDSLGTEQFL